VTGEIGLLALCLALALAIVQSFAGLAGARANGGNAAAIAQGAAMGLVVFVSLAFGALIYAFVVSDFSILDVA
jgi:cytochrome c-type biogenesis protein CcmF